MNHLKKKPPYIVPDFLTFFFAIAIAAVIGSFVLTFKPPQKPVKPKVNLNKVSFAVLPGWQKDKFTEAYPAFEKSCSVFMQYPSRKETGYGHKASEWQKICKKFKKISNKNNKEIKEFFEENFEAFHVTYNGKKTGTFTGYYESEIRGSLKASNKYRYPIYGIPHDMVTFNIKDFDDSYPSKKYIGKVSRGKLEPYPSRAEIEGGAYGIKAPVLLWADNPVDIFILHIQGSGRVSLDNGERLRIGYAGNNGKKFVGIGSIMQRQGLLQPGKSGMPSIRKWLNENPEEARILMEKNPRYIFFRFIKGEGPVGAMGIPLTAKRSMAVDRKYISLGTPIWLDTKDADNKKLQRLIFAQDIGSAIKGAIRGDFFWGSGEFAFNKAGRMKSKGEYYILLPKK